MLCDKQLQIAYICKIDKYTFVLCDRVDVVSDIKKMIDSVKEQTITDMDARKDKTFTGKSSILIHDIPCPPFE